MIAFIIFLFGLAVGSFLLVLIDRLPKNKPVLIGRSVCDHCHKTLTWYELIPVISYVFQRGRCRSCKKKLSVMYPGMEILTGLLFLSLYIGVLSGDISYPLLFSSSMLLFVFLCIVTSTMFVIFFTDLFEEIIPFAVVLVGVIVTGLYLGLSDLFLLGSHVLTGVVTMLFFLTIFLLTKKRGIGFGDVVYGFYMGLFLGFPRVAVGLYVAFLTGAIVSIILVLLRKKKLRGDSIPFGPFLIVGTLVSLVFGDKLWSLFQMYLGL